MGEETSRGRVAVVTGGGAGLGEAIARRLAAVGFAVAVADLDEGRARAVATSLQQAGAEALGVALDVRNAGEVDGLLETVRSTLAPVWVQVNCAGIYPNSLVVEMDETEWDAVLDTNLKGVFLCCRAAARHMIAAGRGGRIVNIASTAARSGRLGAGHYCASKAGVVMLTQVLAMELAPYRINVTAVAPGVIEVPGATSRVTPEYRAAALAHIPLGALGRPADIAEAVLFLVGDGGRYVTGETLVVDGGFLAGRNLPRSATAGEG